MAIDSFIYSLRYMQFYKRDANGWAAGIVDDPNNVDSSAGPVISGALVLNNPISVPAAEVTRNLVTEKGGSEIKQKIDAGISDFSEVEIQMTRINSVMNKIASGVGINTALWSHATLGGVDMAPKNLNNLGMIYFTRASDYDPSIGFTPGLFAAFETQGTLAVKTFEANQNDGENPTPITGTWAPTKVSQLFNGLALSTISGLNYTDGETLQFPYGKMSAFFHVATIWLPDADTGLTVTLPYKPLSSVVTAGGANLITKNGVANNTTITAINTSTGVVTLASSGYVEGDIIHIAYPTNLVAA